jgi:RNA-splicing ligase RtcB
MDNVIRKNIPHGYDVYPRSREKTLINLFKLDLNELNYKNKKDLDRAFKSAGSLGGGNHYLEVNKDSSGGLYLTVHTGSRNIGNQIAKFYQNKAIKYCQKENSYKKIELIEHLKENEAEKNIQRELDEIKKEFYIDKELCYLTDELMEQYLNDMEIAQRFAETNRILILSDIIYNYIDRSKKFQEIVEEVTQSRIECIHNYIDLESRILRKGAISANLGEDVLIPINMRDGIIIGKGKGNSDWNNSAPHGAGRILSRSQAKDKISMQEYKDSMEEVYSTCVNASTLDESPQAYKPLDEIVENIKDTVEIKEILKPIYNFKSN